ncbi:MAG: peroxidase-related enzyme [Pseudomonadota bacterium]
MASKFPSLPNPPDLSDVFLKFPRGSRALLELHDIVLRGESPLTPGEREMIAAHVSGQNACDYCYGAHSTIASAFGVEQTLFDEMQKDLASAGLDQKMKQLLAYAAKLTKEPSKVTASDAQKVYNAGWSERALCDAVTVCALFNFMNRIVEGTGCSPAAEAAGEDEDEPLHSYLEWGEHVGFLD